MKFGDYIEQEIMQGTIYERRRGSHCMAWIENFLSWTRLTMETAMRLTNEKSTWRRAVKIAVKS